MFLSLRAVLALSDGVVKTVERTFVVVIPPLCYVTVTIQRLCHHSPPRFRAGYKSNSSCYDDDGARQTETDTPQLHTVTPQTQLVHTQSWNTQKMQGLSSRSEGNRAVWALFSRRSHYRVNRVRRRAELCWEVQNGAERCWDRVAEQCWAIRRGAERCWEVLNGAEKCWAMLSVVKRCLMLLNDCMCYNVGVNCDSLWYVLLSYEIFQLDYRLQQMLNKYALKKHTLKFMNKKHFLYGNFVIHFMSCSVWSPVHK